MSYASATSIRAAIERANLDERWEDGQLVGYVSTNPESWCGTYALATNYVEGIGEFVVATKLNQRDGYEVAYQSILGGQNLNSIKEGDRFGFWYEDGVEYIDRTILVSGGSAGVALDIARLYAQEAIYSWATGQCIYTLDPATAL